MAIVPKDFTFSKKDRVSQVRLAVIFLCTSIIVLFFIFDIGIEFSLLAAIFTLIFTVVTYIEPLIIPIVNFLFRETVIIRRIDIYNAVIESIMSADQVVRFKTPTTTWGIYSAGLKVFHETMEAIQLASSRGVKLQIIADIWDWERAQFALALMQSGADVRHAETVHDYYLIKDESILITMGTDISPLRIELLDRNVRRLAGVATISRKQIQIQRAKLIFDEEWEKLSEEETTQMIKKYLSCDCPACGGRLDINFKEGRIVLASGG